jgi:S-DNA-T family DNA segregation ATPase FtsK/SpoIIIE
MVLSLLYKRHGRARALIMIDPKMLELSVYEGIPHLLAPVVTDMKEAANALRWCVAEMERRYQLMAAVGVRNIAGFNRKVRDAERAGKPILDPLMMQNGQRPGDRPEADPPLEAAALHRRHHRRARRHDDDRRQEGRGADRPARAEGARLRHPPDPRHAAAVGRRDHRPHQGQHPDAHRLPGVRKVDSRTILDQGGAESLLGHGDMLYLPPGTSHPTACTAPSSPIDEVHRVVASISGVQRRLKIGYNRAARLVEAMESAGVVGPLQSNGSREVIAPPPP